MEIRRNRSKTILAMVILFILAVVVAVGTLGYFWYQKTHSSSDDSPSSGSSSSSISLDTEPKVDTEKIQTALVIPKSTDKPGDTIKVSALTMTVPKVWRTANGKNVLNTSLDNIYAESYNDILAQLIMVPESQPTDPLLATNGFSLYNITSWLSKSTSGIDGTVTPAVKAAYIQNIADIGNGQAADKTVCNKGYGVLNASICSTLLEATPLTSTDGTLKGVAFLNTMAQAVSYDPQVFVFLVGQVKDQQIFGYGAFHLLDNNSHTLNADDTTSVAAAWNSFKSGNVPSDTKELYQHVVDAMKSISIQAN
jgi:hypothetical protein